MQPDRGRQSNTQYRQAITRRPCRNLANGITKANLGIPDYQKALGQHQTYIETLEKCGLQVTVLKSDEQYPDSVFVEDPALVFPEFAVIANPGAKSRQGETAGMYDALIRYYPAEAIEQISAPGTLEGGDVMTVGRHCFIGLSKRTNRRGANQLIQVLQKYGLSGSMIPVKNILHLKTGLTYLDNNHLVVTGPFAGHPEFESFDKIVVEKANCLWINGRVLVIEGIPETKEKIEALGFPVIEVPFSEYLKLDGGLGCLSLRW